jgi:hypothetical protein
MLIQADAENIHKSMRLRMLQDQVAQVAYFCVSWWIFLGLASWGLGIGRTGKDQHAEGRITCEKIAGVRGARQNDEKEEEKSKVAT